MKCNKCKKKIGVLSIFKGICNSCSQNKKEIEKIRNLIFNGIDKLEKIRERGIEDKRIKKVFKNHFDEVIGSLYGSIFSTIIGTLERSVETGFEQGTIKEKEHKDFTNFIKLWSKKADDEDFQITKEDYDEFKDDLKKIKKSTLKGLNKLVNNIEKQLDLKELVKEIDNYVQEVEEEEINENEFGEVEINVTGQGIIFRNIATRIFNTLIKNLQGKVNIFINGQEYNRSGRKI